MKVEILFKTLESHFMNGLSTQTFEKKMYEQFNKNYHSSTFICPIFVICTFVLVNISSYFIVKFE